MVILEMSEQAIRIDICIGLQATAHQFPQKDAKGPLQRSVYDRIESITPILTTSEAVEKRRS